MDGLLVAQQALTREREILADLLDERRRKHKVLRATERAAARRLASARKRGNERAADKAADALAHASRDLIVFERSEGDVIAVYTARVDRAERATEEKREALRIARRGPRTTPGWGARPLGR